MNASHTNQRLPGLPRHPIHHPDQPGVRQRAFLQVAFVILLFLVAFVFILCGMLVPLYKAPRCRRPPWQTSPGPAG